MPRANSIDKKGYLARHGGRYRPRYRGFIPRIVRLIGCSREPGYIQIENPSGVFCQYLFRLVLRNVSEQLVERDLCIGVRSFGVGVVTPKHQIIDPEKVTS